MAVAYHGTPHVEQVAREGLRQSAATCADGCIWLARNPVDAAVFGTVFAVDMSDIPGDFEPDEWQAHYNGGDLGPERLTLYSP